MEGEARGGSGDRKTGWHCGGWAWRPRMVPPGKFFDEFAWDSAVELPGSGMGLGKAWVFSHVYFIRLSIRW